MCVCVCCVLCVCVCLQPPGSGNTDNTPHVKCQTYEKEEEREKKSRPWEDTIPENYYFTTHNSHTELLELCLMSNLKVIDMLTLNQTLAAKNNSLAKFNTNSNRL